ncbi:hypothetical protein JYT74_01355 [Crocinitomix catalasitica]|nr:hypothetical protein [Crocinitomix catalasitica]
MAILLKNNFVFQPLITPFVQWAKGTEVRVSPYIGFRFKTYLGRGNYEHGGGF